jgi:hypothetical protein
LKSDPENQKRDSDRNDAPAVTATVAKPSVIDTDCASNKKHKADAEARDKTRLRLEAFGLAVLLAYTGFTGYMACQMKSSTDAAAIAADAATTAANAAITNNRIASESQRLDQRAWVIVDNYSPTPLKAGEPFGIMVNFKNTGRTPARQMIGWTALDPLPRGKSPTFKQRRQILGGTLPPNGGSHHVTAFQNTEEKQVAPLTEASVAAIMRGETVLWIYGGYTYSDVFGASHWMQYCAYYVPPDGSPGNATGATSFCTHHNDVGDGPAPPSK